MRDEFHPAVEEYLQAIASLAEERSPLIQARLAARLGKTSASVSEMLDRLTDAGYLERSGRNITLTTTGRSIAEGVVRKHRLAERLLVDVIGLPWHLAHVEAGRWEHVISDDVEQRLVELLGDPGTCPHGNPIPGSTHETAELSPPVSLVDALPGQSVRFVRITEEVELDLAALRYLDESGFIPGRVATVRSKAPDDTLVLDVEGKTLALGAELCRKLYVSGA